MSFSDDFASCLSPLPAPSFDSLDDLLEWIHKIHDAWENSGGSEELLMGALITAGAVTGIDEAALATLATATVATYLAACLACAVKSAGSSIWDAITAENDPYIKQQLTVAANDAGIKPDTSLA